MRILRWIFVLAAALLVGLGFAVLSESLVLAVIPVASILVLAGYLSLGRRQLGSPGLRRRRRTGSIGSGAAYTGSTDGGSSVDPVYAADSMEVAAASAAMGGRRRLLTSGPTSRR